MTNTVAGAAYVPRHAKRRRLLSPRGASVVAAAVLASCATQTAAFAEGIPVPAPPTGLPAGIEPFAPYQPQEICYPAAQVGVVAFRNLILHTYPHTGDDGIVRECSAPDGSSEHKDGRAWDWLVRAAVPAERAEADTLLRWLTRRDAAGYTAANARRLGLMYMVWNGRIWKSYHAALGWQTYRGSDPHVGHVHFSFSWAGALGRTSYFSHHVAPPILGPDLPLFGAGSKGPAVLDLQHLLQVRTANGFFGTTTQRAIANFQRAHRLPASGLLTRATWAALLPPATPIPSPVPVRLQWRGSTVLRAGANGAAVHELQRLLAVGNDGSFGPGTEAAVRHFQVRAHLTPDGVVGAQTWRRLRVTFERAQARGRGAPRHPHAHGHLPAHRHAHAGKHVVRAHGRGPAPVVTVAAPLRLGATGPTVIALQRRVHVPTDGVFGPGTDRAVRAFQRRHHLVVDGVVGAQTWPRRP